ncbi:hypothetical protein ACIGG6_01550 [Vreelandella lionensis]|uniref:Uncharacterized protein n=1 Tax=Vreelandella lionensis TaxID=1144478 RepID=A0ABW8BNZ8_9GAMM|nr:hypothetical protein [Halomonas sp.]
MRKWIMMSLANWLRKPKNRQKAKTAWNDLRGRNNGKRTPQQSQATRRDSSTPRSNEPFDNRR